MDNSRSQEIHDFINNGLRLEVLNKLISESLEKKQDVDREYVSDLKKYLSDHIELANKIFPN